MFFHHTDAKLKLTESFKLYHHPRVICNFKMSVNLIVYNFFYTVLDEECVLLLYKNQHKLFLRHDDDARCH